MYRKRFLKCLYDFYCVSRVTNNGYVAAYRNGKN